MIVFSNTITPRLGYITRFIGEELINSGFSITDNINEFKNSADQKINYSRERITPGEYWILPHTLLLESEIKLQDPVCFEINDFKAFFKTEGDFPFDIFAASFYLLTRYEEYLPHGKDQYGRYAHQNSLAYKEGFLGLPLVNIWLQYFAERLKQKFPALPVQKSSFTFLPTYDIDEGYCYRHKPWWKSWGGYARSLLRGDFWELKERRNVLKNVQHDPYDSLEQIKDLHRKYTGLEPIIFFLVAEKNSRYDKNISPVSDDWKNRIQRFFEKMPEEKTPDQTNPKGGLHPSWRSGDKPVLLKRELDILQRMLPMEVHGSRQHFIRFNLPKTYRQLLEAGIRSDYSMGYGSINGFRASVASSFYWYDLGKEESTDLLLFPFCYMDANSFFEQKYSPQKALEEMLQYFHIIQSVNGLMITIWHNTFLGTHRRFAGWRAVYEEFVGKIYDQLPSVKNHADKPGLE